jgi:hypothetical protein
VSLSNDGSRITLQFVVAKVPANRQRFEPANQNGSRTMEAIESRVDFERDEGTARRRIRYWLDAQSYQVLQAEIAKQTSTGPHGDAQAAPDAPPSRIARAAVPVRL